MMIFCKGEMVEQPFSSQTYIDKPDCYNEAALQLYDKLLSENPTISNVEDGTMYELLYVPAQLIIKRKL